ncbi:MULTISPECIES: Rha family transcriptional regulator [Acinetobacter]|uniref:Rha family transcriptional regulator n=1 Tax=Acinetobacter TaxID=469 RepID=UPI0002AE83D6|nr:MULTISPECIES: Rha family transcriptional regulator [Acinetobacter]ELW77032.1 phage regulatory protein Rha [Acinetobacter sp. WC-743]
MSNLTLHTNNATAYNNTSVSIIANPNVQTMSSKEIAIVTGKDHSNILRDIRTMLDQLQDSNLNPNDYQVILASNNMTAEILLNKDLSMCLVSGYNVQLRMAIIKRWNELETQVLEMVKPSYMIEDPIERAKKWIEEATAKQAVETKLVEATQAIEVMQPTVDAYELIAGKKGSMCFSDAYKYLGGIKLKEMKQWMYDKKWINKDRYDRDSIGYYQNMNGYLVEKVTTHQPQIRITYKGLAAMARQMKIELNVEDFQ